MNGKKLLWYDNIKKTHNNDEYNSRWFMTFVRGNNSSGLMNIYKQLRALFACVVCSSLP